VPRAILCREFFIWLSAQKKHLANRLLCREPNKKLSAQKETLAIDFFTESQTKNSRQRKFKKSFFSSNFFLSSTYAYTKLMLKFGTISTLFAIFKNFTPF
jgi:hypothetical protein